MTTHRTLPAAAAIHASGWTTLPSGVEVTKISLVDKTKRLPDGSDYLFACLSYKDAKAFAAANGARLVSPRTIREIRDVGLHVEPVTINPDSTELSASLDHADRFWNHNHVTSTPGLRELHWDGMNHDGKQVVCGAGKWWHSGAPAGRAYLMGWWTQHLERFSPGRHGPGFVQEEDHDQGRHGEDMFDYGTLTMLERGGPAPADNPPPSSKPEPEPQAGPPEPVPSAPSAPPSSPDTQPARTRLGDADQPPPGSVTAWQLWLLAHGYAPGKADGIHGGRTEAASLAYERAARPSVPAPVGHGVSDIEFIQAKNYTPANRTRIDWVVLHSTEPVPVKMSTIVGQAHGVAMYFAGPNAPQASSHYVVGPEAAFQCVREQDVAWAAPGANRTGIQIEQVGWAARTEWERVGSDARAGRLVLERSAKLVAAICKRWNVPIVRVDADGLLAGQRGITSHAAATAAFKKSDHQDPGLQGDKRWPWDLFLSLVAAG